MQFVRLSGSLSADQPATPGGSQPSQPHTPVEGSPAKPGTPMSHDGSSEKTKSPWEAPEPYLPPSSAPPTPSSQGGVHTPFTQSSPVDPYAHPPGTPHPSVSVGYFPPVLQGGVVRTQGEGTGAGKGGMFPPPQAPHRPRMSQQSDPFSAVVQQQRHPADQFSHQPRTPRPGEHFARPTGPPTDPYSHQPGTPRPPMQGHSPHSGFPLRLSMPPPSHSVEDPFTPPGGGRTTPGAQQLPFPQRPGMMAPFPGTPTNPTPFPGATDPTVTSPQTPDPYSLPPGTPRPLPQDPYAQQPATHGDPYTQGPMTPRPSTSQEAELQQLIGGNRDLIPEQHAMVGNNFSYRCIVELCMFLSR